MTSLRPASSHDTATWFEQSGFGIRFGWGPNDLRRLAPAADVVVIVDVLSFSTAVDVALGRGAIVLPYARHDGTEQEFADANDAVVASQRQTTTATNAAERDATGPTDTPRATVPTDGRSASRPTDAPSASEQNQGADDASSIWSLSPASLTTIAAGTRLVLPSPNGSALAFRAKDAGAGEILVACHRNASATARACVDADVVAVIAAGERWRGATGPLRPALEDLLGAGAIIDALTTLRACDGDDHLGNGGAHDANSGKGQGNDRSSDDDDERRSTASSTGDREPSPEAMAAAAAFREARTDLGARLAACGSGRELIDRGFAADVELAAALDVSTVAATLDGHELRPNMSWNRRRKPSP